MSKPRYTKAPSGRSYRLWENGDGVTVIGADGRQLHDMGSHVAEIPLCDVPVLAKLLAKQAKDGAA